MQERWTQWYDSLLQVRMNSRLGVGRPAILRLTPLGEDRIADQLVAIQWEGEREDLGFDLVIVNVTGQGGCCALDLSGLPGSAVEKVFRSRLGTAPGVDAPTPAGVGRPPTMALQIRQLGRNRIVLEVPPHGIGWWNVTSAT